MNLRKKLRFAKQWINANVHTCETKYQDSVSMVDLKTGETGSIHNQEHVTPLPNAKLVV